MSNGTPVQQAIPFPPTPPVYPGVRFTPAMAFIGLSTSTPIVYFDPVTLVEHAATISSNDGRTLTISTEGKSIPLPIAGDGTASIPVTILASP
jgi:hypothetical protein